MLKHCDWVVEAIIERLDIKRALLAKVEAVIGPDTIVSSNTSGIPIALIAEGRTDAFQRRWLGTHFFNPPRYLKLLELIPTDETDPAVVARLADFGDRHLGKGVVVAKDTPNFIANHLGMFGMARSSRRSPMAATRSRRSTPSPARHSAAPRARPSARPTSPGWTCSGT